MKFLYVVMCKGLWRTFAYCICNTEEKAEEVRRTKQFEKGRDYKFWVEPTEVIE